MNFFLRYNIQYSENTGTCSFYKHDIQTQKFFRAARAVVLVFSVFSDFLTPIWTEKLKIRKYKYFFESSFFGTKSPRSLVGIPVLSKISRRFQISGRFSRFPCKICSISTIETMSQKKTKKSKIKKIFKKNIWLAHVDYQKTLFRCNKQFWGVKMCQP